MLLSWVSTEPCYSAHCRILHFPSLFLLPFSRFSLVELFCRFAQPCEKAVVAFCSLSSPLSLSLVLFLLAIPILLLRFLSPLAFFLFSLSSCYCLRTCSWHLINSRRSDWPDGIHSSVRTLLISWTIYNTYRPALQRTFARACYKNSCLTIICQGIVLLLLLFLAVLCVLALGGGYHSLVSPNTWWQRHKNSFVHS